MIELLVVIAIVGILAGILLPALGGAKAKGQAIVCLNNHRQLTFACLLYANDYEDSLPYNLGSIETKQVVADGTYLNWVNNVMSWDHLDPDNTNTLLLTRGGLAPYTSGGISIYRCPSDYVLDDLQRAAGWSARTRSISMNAMVGNAGEFTASGANTNNPSYRQFFKLSQIPYPSDIFMFIEEHPDSIDDGYFLNRAYSGKWNDLPASYHEDGAHLSFADGHVQRHRWRFDSTKPPARAWAAKLPRLIPEGEEGDFEWLMQHTSYKRYAPKPEPAYEH